MTTGVETFEFQAEARQLLDLMIHSVYSNKDIFLRELISNASDALDRLRFEAIAKPELTGNAGEFEIRLEPDTDAHTLAIRDNGAGMTREEVIRLIGTIAKSGTKEFLARYKEAKASSAPDLIGQFGVGFYSCFMVADRVTLITRRAGEASATRWESEGDGTYTIEETTKPEQGTIVTLHLKDADPENGLFDYAQEWKLREIIKKYSDFVAYPIRMKTQRKEKPRDADGKVKEDAPEEIIVEDATLNSMKAIWLRDRAEVTADEYQEFYKHVSHDWNEPLKTISARIEGTLLYRMLLFIPSRAPFDLFMREGRRGVQLYVKRVFIMDDCDALLPEYLRYIRGVVDSEDLSLNLSREILQQDRQIQRMKKGVVGKVLSALKELRDSEMDKYKTFWHEFGAAFKSGIYEDQENRDDILGLCLFDSTHSPDTPTSLKDYISRMKEGQDCIYFMTGESRKAVENSPHLEGFLEKGYEALILTHPVDSLWTQWVPEFEGKRFQSIGKGAVELGTEEEKKAAEEGKKKQQEIHASLLECIKNALEEYVKEVRLSTRLTKSPACLVGEQRDMDPQMEQLLRSMNQDVPTAKRILELNPTHPLLERLQVLYDANREDPRLSEYAQLLYGQAVLAEGNQVPDPSAFSHLVADLMMQAI